IATAIVAHSGAPRQQANTAVVGFECDPLHISPKKDWFVTSGRSASRARSCLDHGASFLVTIAFRLRGPRQRTALAQWSARRHQMAPPILVTIAFRLRF